MQISRKNFYSNPPETRLHTFKIHFFIHLKIFRSFFVYYRKSLDVFKMVRILTNNGLHNYLIRISILFIIILQLWTGICLAFNYNIPQIKLDRYSSFHRTGPQSFSEPSVHTVITNQSFLK